VLVCFAVREEARYFIPSARPATLTRVTGIGIQKAAAAIQDALATHHPALVLTCGFAGGLNPVHPVGRVLFDDALAGSFRNRLTPSGAVAGRFTHSDRILVTATEKRKLFETSGADAVEMESSAIVAACRERGLPVMVVRVISDAATEDLPLDFNRFTRPDGSLSMPQLLLGIAKSPAAVPKLRAFQRRLDLAARNLATTLGSLLSSDDLA